MLALMELRKSMYVLGEAYGTACKLLASIWNCMQALSKHMELHLSTNLENFREPQRTLENLREPRGTLEKLRVGKISN